MASIINSISFNNFFNYYGSFDENIYELEEGVNIIVADNGAGKSKFFNAFLWLFNDQILDSDVKTTKNIENVYVKIVSDKAKHEAPIKGQVKCGIQVEYTYGKRKKYKIIKSFILTKLNENISDRNSWQFTPCDVEVYQTDLILPKYKAVYSEDEKRQIIDKLIMPSLRKYSFLQGEEIDEMIDFSNKSSIEEAVQNLTDIKKYEDLVELTEYIREKAEKDLKAQNKANTAQSERLQEAMTTKNNYQINLENESKVLKEYEETYSKAEKEKNELDKIHANAEKRKEVDDKLKDVRKKYRTATQEYSTFLEKINNRFFDGNFAWISMGFNDVVSDFQKLDEHFNEERYKKKLLNESETNPSNYLHILPINSPDYMSLDDMIKNEHCYVCNRAAISGTHEHEHLVQLRDRPKDSIKKESFVKNDLRAFFGDLKVNAQPFYGKINNVKSTIKQTKSKEIELRDRLSRISEKVKSLENERDNILISGKDSESNAKEIIDRYKTAIRIMENSRTKIDDITKPKIQALNSDIKKISNEIESYTKSSDIPKGYSENFSISKDLANATIKAKERVYDNMINLLEEHANIHFQNLISRNELAGGLLRFKKEVNGSIIFEYSDLDGNIVSGSSEGFQRMKKFSVVLAIISANNSKFNYPLLADAPISAFGEGFTEGFFEATGKVFPQSIVLVKELYKVNDEMKINDLGKRLLKDENVKTMYVNQVNLNSEDKTSEKVKQIDLVTNKIKLK